jgi:hypothetical protein
MMFFKGTASEKKYSQDNFRGIHTFKKIPIVKVLFSNLLSKKGMSYVTYPMRERVNLVSFSFFCSTYYCISGTNNKIEKVPHGF